MKQIKQMLSEKFMENVESTPASRKERRVMITATIAFAVLTAVMTLYSITG